MKPHITATIPVPGWGELSEALRFSYSRYDPEIALRPKSAPEVRPYRTWTTEMLVGHFWNHDWEALRSCAISTLSVNRRELGREA